MKPVHDDQKWSEMTGGQRATIVAVSLVLIIVAAWALAIILGLMVKALGAVWS